MFFQAEDGIRDLVRSRGLGDVYKRQGPHEGRLAHPRLLAAEQNAAERIKVERRADLGLEDPLRDFEHQLFGCLLYTSDAADERSSVDLGGRRIIQKNTKKKNKKETTN